MRLRIKPRQFIMNEARTAHTCTVCNARIEIGDMHKRYKTDGREHHACATCNIGASQQAGDATRQAVARG